MFRTKKSKDKPATQKKMLTSGGRARPAYIKGQNTKANVKHINGEAMGPKLKQVVPSTECPQSPFKNVNAMTSRDFEIDHNAHLEVVAQQLRDHHSINCFKDAILHNRHIFRGRTVLNIGCGIGLLALFSAKAGAKRVFAVDTSNVLDYMQQIVHENGYADVIQIIKGHVTKIQLPVPEIDIIVCNWAGFSLLFQSRCAEVIYARDKWLKKDGLIYPDTATLFIAAVEDTKHKNERIDWWNDVYGFNMQCIRRCALSEPRYKMIKPGQIMSSGWRIKELDLNKATKQDLKLRSKYAMKMCRTGWMDGIVTYFRLHFSKAHVPITLNTDHRSPRTQWLQSVFYFDSPHHVRKESEYLGGIEMTPMRDDDLNSLHVAFEMFKNDSAEIILEIDMNWQLKPHFPVFNDGENDDDDKNVLVANGAVVKNTSNNINAAVLNSPVPHEDKNAVVSNGPVPKDKHEYKNAAIVNDSVAKHKLDDIDRAVGNTEKTKGNTLTKMKQDKIQTKESHVEVVESKNIQPPITIVIGDCVYPCNFLKRGRRGKHGKKN